MTIEQLALLLTLAGMTCSIGSAVVGFYIYLLTPRVVRHVRARVEHRRRMWPR